MRVNKSDLNDLDVHSHNCFCITVSVVTTVSGSPLIWYDVLLLQVNLLEG